MPPLWVAPSLKDVLDVITTTNDAVRCHTLIATDMGNARDALGGL